MDFQIILARGDNDNTAVSITSFHRMMTRMVVMLVVMLTRRMTQARQQIQAQAGEALL